MIRLNVPSFAAAFGAMWSVFMLYAGLAATADAGTSFVVEAIAPVYPGFGPTMIGSVAGAAWGFLDGAIKGAILAVVYNGIADLDD
ncbi:membrane-associated protein [Halobacteriales archaeon QS_1_68_20]|nr:MAG: membrane-associated protein [Halobacteriales archaeon QS_1_68_20]